MMAAVSPRPRILVVDDETGPRESLRMLLKPLYEIRMADSARAALEVLGELSTRIQILFFTHLERDLALSADAVPASLRFEHRLGAPVLVPAASAGRRARRAER